MVWEPCGASLRVEVVEELHERERGDVVFACEALHAFRNLVPVCALRLGGFATIFVKKRMCPVEVAATTVRGANTAMSDPAVLTLAEEMMKDMREILGFVAVPVKACHCACLVAILTAAKYAREV
ncbi:MAG: hypothetical protein HYV25_00060 [Candidatus Harrisonbacteria bacterium]|nr:hypothetical protein [Candidatus Harrisonbacteria bacterium]